MIVERDRVVRLHYTLSDDTGRVIESSRGGEPMSVLHGHRNVIEGVDEGLAGHSAGDRFTLTVPPDKGYGERMEGRVQRVAKKYMVNGKRLKAGDEGVISTREGPRSVTVVKVGSSVVDVDLNHPLAGKTLSFDIEILEVRAAQPEEIEHGHVHGPGGHGH